MSLAIRSPMSSVRSMSFFSTSCLTTAIDCERFLAYDKMMRFLFYLINDVIDFDQSLISFN